jgi:virginiamycin B lyase
MWFVETNAGRVGRITPQGAVTEFGVSAPSSQPAMIASGPAKTLWFTETAANRIGYLVP